MLSKVAILCVDRAQPEEPQKITFEWLPEGLRHIEQPVAIHLPTGETLVVEASSLEYAAAYVRVKRQFEGVRALGAASG